MDFHNLGHTCVVGMHWGDEGKGKIVDMLTEYFDIVVRYNGGGNAGHTVQVGSEKFAFHLLPVGVLNENKTAVVGPGVALDVGRMLEEIDNLAQRGISVAKNLKISNRAHLAMPWHKMQDLLSESALGNKKIGTTARGIGPCYSDKMQRATAVRVIDLLDHELLREKIARIAQYKNTLFNGIYQNPEPVDAQAIIDEYLGYAERLKDNICDSTEFFYESMQDGKKLLFEGANGTLLDIDHGTFPYVTSSTTCAIGVPAGAGVPASTVKTCIGVTKAYTTRVGSGPFPSELHDDIGQRIRDRGHEYGTTTGRPRRCGWFDAVAARYSARLSGMTHVAVMHLDTLAELEQIGICTGYEMSDGKTCGFVADSLALEKVKPIIEYMPGWQEDLREAKTISDLPQAVRNYIDRLEALIGTPIAIASVGPERTQTLLRT